MPKEPTTSKNPRETEKRLVCSCLKFCKGTARQVSKSTYLRHSRLAATIQPLLPDASATSTPPVLLYQPLEDDTVSFSSDLS